MNLGTNLAQCQSKLRSTWLNVIPYAGIHSEDTMICIICTIHRNLSASTALTAITMINEREVAINPIVQESVQHNTQVKLPFPTLPLRRPN